MLNITNREFSIDTWNQMVIEAADSRNDDREHKNICKVIYPDDTCKLELKTNQEVKKHFQTYGSWSANCAKMPLRDVLNITRICSLNGPINSQTKDSIKNSLSLFGSLAERKYNSGVRGIVRKVIAIFFNLFTSDSVSLFGMSKTNVSLNVVNYNRGKLPWFIGNDANFVHLINTTRFS